MLNKQRAALTVLAFVVAYGAACLLLTPTEPAPPVPPRGVEAVACAPREGTAIASNSENAAPVRSEVTPASHPPDRSRQAGPMSLAPSNMLQQLERTFAPPQRSDAASGVMKTYVESYVSRLVLPDNLRRL